MGDTADITAQNLTEKQLKAIPLILGAKSISEGIGKAKISRTTFYEWMKAPEFKSEFVRQRQEIVEVALCELKTAAGEAVAVMRKLLTSRNEGIRLRTAQGMLEHILKSIQLEELEQRITELERRAKK
ncbi:MAG: hypothetical protein M0R70_05750 [Nitrospirae bacterium]|nr:hypothetical protein [Nitrospirota bacterium]